MPQMQNPAGANGEACESTHLARRDIQQATPAESNNQDLVCGAIFKNKRETIRIGLRTFGPDRLCDVRIFKNIHGADTGTEQGVTIRPANIRKAIEALELAEVAARAEGLL